MPTTSRRPPVLLSWSSGKDSAWALHVLREQGELEVVGLVTTVNRKYERVAMHGVRRVLLEAQAAAAGLPLWVVEIPAPCSNEEYERAMGALITRAVAQGIHHMAFGDLFLEDIRAYRVDRLRGTGVDPVFPIWGIPTGELAARMVAGGLRAKLTCVDPRVLSPSFAGRDFDAELLNELPATIDPCGERGEFHSFAYAGPMFAAPIGVQVGEVVEREGFVFADVLPT
jgi:uncharacterized protein (TIGR00290 family)